MSASTKLEKHRRTQSLTLPAAAPTQTNLSQDPRPPYHTRKWSKWDSEPVLQNLRHALKRTLPKGWGSRVAYEKLALDLYITAVGLSGANRIRNFTLSYEETVAFAVELAKVINTSDLLLVLDTVSDQLLVVHTHILMLRLESADNTIFLSTKAGRLSSCRSEVLKMFETPFAFFSCVLRQSSVQVVRGAELGWSPLETSCYLETLVSWLMEHPVIIYRPLNGTPIESWQGDRATLAIHFEGCEASFDHTLDPFYIPRDILGNDDVPIHDQPESRSHSSIGNRLSLSAIQDNAQSLMFERLNATESALFADISCEILAAHTVHYLAGSSTTPS